MLKKIFVFILVLGVLSVVALAGIAIYTYNYFNRDLPKIEQVSDFHLNSVSTVFSEDGTIVAEFFEEQRYPVKITEIPEVVRNAFLAAEDASFYKHPGIDLISILRAALKNLQTGSAKQGASTITQQVVKNILLSSEKKLERKIKEAILAYRLEKYLSKNDILELYLNQIFFGNRAYGIKAAVKNYFGKDLANVTLAEAAILAGLPKAPSRYSPISNLKAAKARQAYVLRQMVESGFISKDQAKAAAKEDVKIFKATNDRILEAPYYIAEVRRQIEEKWRDYRIDLDGLKIYTALDRNAYKYSEIALKQGLREPDKRQGWRGPLEQSEMSESNYLKKYYPDSIGALKIGEVYPALVRKINQNNNSLQIQVGQHFGTLDLSKAGWAKKLLKPDGKYYFYEPKNIIKVGQVIEASLLESKEKKQDSLTFILDQTPKLEGAIVIIDPSTGKVPAVVGGYDYDRSQFNRATQGLRQPGSAFKPVLYLAAVEANGFTPSTIVYDQPRTFKVGQTEWAPANYDKEYLGPIPLRIALERSRNIVSADIISRIGVETVIQYAKKLGIESPLGQNLSLSLGSSEVTPLEITRAYGVLANKGVYYPSTFITKIEDRLGNVVYDFEEKKLSLAKQVISPASAFIMSNMLKGVVEYGTGQKIKEIKRPVAGKTGTSNDQMDAWFIGFTPEWACGVWIGFDEKKEIGDKETGGRVAAPIWLYAMRDFLNYRDQAKFSQIENEAKEEAERLGIEYSASEMPKPLDFTIPEGIEPAWIDRNSGTEVVTGTSGAFLEYYIKGTGPNKPQNQIDSVNEYWNLPE
jgi:penicillin-binding protein 1A